MYNFTDCKIFKTICPRTEKSAFPNFSMQNVSSGNTNFNWLIQNDDQLLTEQWKVEI